MQYVLSPKLLTRLLSKCLHSVAF